MYTDKEIREEVNSQIRREQQIRKQIEETIDFKLHLRAEEIVSQIIKEKGLELSKEERKLYVEDVIKKFDSSQGKNSIVVNEMDL